MELGFSLLKELEILEKNTKEKNKFLQQTGWLSVSKQSYFTDRIASTIPANISLTKLSVFPLDDKNSKKEKKKNSRVSQLSRPKTR